MPSHPLVKHWLAVARNRLSPPPIFRSALAELGRVLIYEAAHDWLPTIDGQVCSRAPALFTVTSRRAREPGWYALARSDCCRLAWLHLFATWCPHTR